MGEYIYESEDQASTMSQGPITHIVLFKYRSDLTWTEFEKHFESFMALKTTSLNPRTGKPLVKSLKAGKNRSWEPFNKGMTHGFVLEFESQADLDYYLLEEPIHLQFSKNAGPLIEDSVVVDIRDGILFGPPAKRPFLSNEHRGACHCGEIIWTAKLDQAEHVLCHCRTCQQLGGGPYSCNQIVPRENLKITNGQPKVYTYKGASGNSRPHDESKCDIKLTSPIGKSVRCYFCGNCTSHIYHHQDMMPDKVIVRTLLLDQGPQMPATGEIFAEGRLSWVQELKEELSR